MLENLVVEAVGAIEQALQLAEEHARFRTLNDAVIVGAGQRHDLTDAEGGAGLGRRALVFGRVIDGAGGADGALAGDQPRGRRHGTHRAGVGERNGGPLEIRRRELAGARAGHQVVECVDVFLELKRAGVLDVRDHEAAGVVLTGDVHGDAEVDPRRRHTERVPVLFHVSSVQRRDLFERLDDGPTDQVRVRYLAAAEQGPVLVDDAPVLVHYLDGDGALRSGQGDGDAGGHVLRDAAGGAAEGLELVAGGGRRGGGETSRS